MEVQRLGEVFNLQVRRVDMGVLVVTSPSFGSRHYMLVQPDLPESLVDFLVACRASLLGRCRCSSS